MYESLKRFKAINTVELQEKSYEQIVEIFQSTQNKKLRDKCFAYIYCDLFPMLLRIFEKYTMVEPVEKVEHCISTLLHSMKEYKKGNKTKFTSYAYGNISRALLTATTAYKKNNKKKVWNNLITGDDQTVTFALSKTGQEDKYLSNFELISSINNSNLDNLEKCLCVAYSQGFKKSDELISAVANTTNPIQIDNKFKRNVMQARNSLRKKIREHSDGIFSLK